MAFIRHQSKKMQKTKYSYSDGGNKADIILSISHVCFNKNKKKSQKLHPISKDFGHYCDLFFLIFFLKLEHTLNFYCLGIPKKKYLKTNKNTVFYFGDNTLMKINMLWRILQIFLNNYAKLEIQSSPKVLLFKTKLKCNQKL